MTGQASAVSQGHAHAVLRKATRTLHASLDSSFVPSNLASRSGYVRYLLMNCPCTWIEPALTDAGIHRLLPDWDQRQRQLALAADLEALEVTPDPPRARIIEADAGTILGWSYVLEGSRLGARLLLKTVQQSEDRDVSSATRFLRQGVGTDLWGSFKAVLSEIDHDTDAIAKACAAAILAFECFKDALSSFPGGFRTACARAPFVAAKISVPLVAASSTRMALSGINMQSDCPMASAVRSPLGAAASVRG
jgi:heme oxygenase